MRKLPENYEKDEDKATIKAALKACGYGWFECTYLIQATNMKRGVRLVLNFDRSGTRHNVSNSGQSTMKLCSGHLQIRKVVNQERTDYKQDDPFWEIGPRRGTNVSGSKNRIECSDHQDLVEKMVRAADLITGDPAISKDAHKDLLQNLVLDDLKKRLLKEQPKLRVQFGAKAKADDKHASLRIGLPNLTRTDNKTQYGIDELVIFLSGGKVSIQMGDFHTFRDNDERTYSVPDFADPAFDPENFYTFVIATLDRMRLLHQHCLDRQNEIDRLNAEIAEAKCKERDESVEFWQKTWFGD